MRLEDELKAYARAIGIHSLGIGSAAPFPEEAALLESMREEGTYPAFTERDPALRTRPGRWLKNAASVIAIAVSYHSQEHHHPPARGELRGLVSRYAWGRDYHPVLKEKLDAVVSFLSQRVGRPVAFAPFVDTGPPVERAVAVRAGIGWFGKNACIYTPRHGSYVFLAQVVTDVELEPDPPVSRACGPCDRCIRACPTGAIERPFWVNPYKCLSYITQMPGMIPKEYRKAMGRRLWGCDVCQIVCPWNWEAEKEGDPAFSAGEGEGPRPELIPLLTMSNAQFRARFGRTAMGWRGKKTIQRNACICLGNIGDPRAVPALADRLHRDPKPVVRASAAWALGEIGGAQARRELERALRREQDPMVIGEIRDALDAAGKTAQA
ncbi:MAG: tRNA epoxyqueuosine(34) reductase QueG [Limnochordia bacterium]